MRFRKPTVRSSSPFPRAWKWQQRLLKDRRAELSRRWRNRGAEARLHRKRERKARKLEKREEKLRTLVLAEAKNQILPRAA